MAAEKTDPEWARGRARLAGLPQAGQEPNPEGGFSPPRWAAKPFFCGVRA